MNREEMEKEKLSARTLMIKEAKKRLEETSDSIQQVARDFGYKNSSSFSFVFEKSEGVLPSIYKWRARATKVKTLLRKLTIPLDEVAAKTGYNDVPSMSDAFKRVTGKAPQVYRMEYKMKKVKRLLGKSDMPLKEIAQAVGYKRLSILSSTFKNATGMTLNGYRLGYKEDSLKDKRERQIEMMKDLLRDTSKLFKNIVIEAGFKSVSHASAVFTKEVGLAPRDYRFQEHAKYMKTLLEEDELSLAQIARVFGYRPVGMLKFFKKETGVSPQDYRINCRIGKIKHFLELGELSIGEIAEQVGYVAASMSTIFKKATGMTPREYQKSCFNYADKKTGERDLRALSFAS